MADSGIVLRPSVLLSLADASAFLGVYFNDGSVGGVIVPASSRLAVGDEVEVELSFAAEKMVFHARGIARWRRPKPVKDLPAGFGIEFLASEARTRDLLLDFAKGRDVQLFQRDTRRFPAVIVVEYKTDSVFMTDVTEDLSRAGAFIRCSEGDLPPMGSQVKLKLRPPGYRLGISANAEVVWHRSEIRRGFGVRFVREGRGTRKKLTD